MLSGPQFRMLVSVESGKGAFAHLTGRSAAGGGHNTLVSLRRLGYLNPRQELTEAGRAALVASREACK